MAASGVRRLDVLACGVYVFGVQLHFLSSRVLVGMNIRKPVNAKIMVGARGLGTPDQDLVEQRAREIAEIQEREIPSPVDWEEARRELHGRSIANDVACAVDGQGWRSERFGVQLGTQDEANLGEELIREGMEEAEHERMLLAHKHASDGVEL